MHTPFAFQPGDDQDPRHPDGDVIYDDGVTLEETWAAMEALVDEGLSGAVGLSDIGAERAREIVETARIKPAVIEVAEEVCAALCGAAARLTARSGWALLTMGSVTVFH